MSNHPDFSSHNYQVIRELGRNREGGRVSYLAERLITSGDCPADKQQTVVIKQFRFAQENTNWQGFKAYEREISILQEIKHPQIPSYLDSFETTDGFCMVQEYKDAPDLTHKKSYKPQEIKKIILAVLNILDDLQSCTPIIIHRDIKPENILVDENLRVYLIDFGLARVNSAEMAMSSVMAGTPGFMPPEELFNRPLTTASDLYSVGATMIVLLTNTSAVNISNLIDENYQLKFRHLLPGINPDLLEWLQKMVAPNPKDRYKNAAIARQALQAIDIIGKSQTKVHKFPDVWKYLALASLALASGWYVAFPQSNASDSTATTGGAVTTLSKEEAWYQQMKPSCNAVEVVIAMNRNSYPATPKGAGYAASCYALAGKLDLAEQVIQQLPASSQGKAVAILFNIGHPVADAGDDKSAGPIMDLVVKYWPQNYMAMYHAGMSHYILGEYAQATSQLQAFLQVYQQPDGWTAKAKSALDRISQGIPADQSFSVKH
jgi:serine/threonine protein kinase